MNPDRLAELEEERRFLLRSITDLERELEAGDVEPDDYEVLRDGYTARAASVMRQIDAGRAALPPPRRTGRRVVAAWVVGVIAVASVTGWLVARSSGQRLAGQSMTGGAPVDQIAANLAEARSLLQQDQARALQLYRDVLDLDPTNAEARTYISWLLALTWQGLPSAETQQLAVDQSKAGFLAVVADHPDYADAHCLFAVASARIFPEPDLVVAKQQGELCLATDPPTEMRGLVEQFVASLDTVTSTTGP
ncbi:MAG: hypothetical protein WD023_02265 [Ilumatobacteraceae bacterium]